MGSLIKHYFDACKGRIRRKSWNMQTAGQLNDGSWTELLTPSTGKSIVIFSVLVFVKDETSAARFEVRFGSSAAENDRTKYILMHRYDISTAGNNVPLFIEYDCPVVGDEDDSLWGYTDVATTDQPIVLIVYGEV